MSESMRDILFYSHRTEIEEFEQIGETELRYKIAHGSFFGNRSLAEEWLRQQESERKSERESRSVAAAEDAASAAKEAASAARSQARWAKWAAAIAAAAAIISAYISVSMKHP